MQVLKVVVIVLGALIALGVGVIVYTLIDRGGDQLTQPEQPAPAVGAAAPAVSAARVPANEFGATALGLPQGSLVQQMVVSGDRLIVTVRIPAEGEKIVVIDLASGRTLGSIALGAVP